MNDDGLLKLAFVGPSNAGKTTCSQFASDYLLSHGFNVVKCDAAAPLHLIQKKIFEIFYLPETNQQDGALLQFLAKHYEHELQDLTSKTLEGIISSACKNSVKTAIINSDCRNNMHSLFRRNKFIFVRLFVEEDVLKKRREERGNLSPFNYHSAVEQTNQIMAQFVINNNSSLENLQLSVNKLLSQLVV